MERSMVRRGGEEEDEEELLLGGELEEEESSFQSASYTSPVRFRPLCHIYPSVDGPKRSLVSTYSLRLALSLCLSVF